MTEKEKKKYDKTIDNLKKAIELNPKNYPAYSNLGAIYVQKKEYDKAIEIYKKAIELNSKDDDMYKNITVTDGDNVIEATLKEFLYLNLGVVYSKKREYDNAIENYKKIIELNPKNDTAYGRIGVMYGLKEDYGNAIDNLKKAIELNPQNSIAYDNLGVVYSKKEEYDKAIENCKKAIELNPQYGNAYGNLGAIYGQKKDYGNAIDNLKKAIKLNSKDDNTYENLGVIYYQNKKYDSAIENFKKAIELNPKDGSKFEKIIETYFKVEKTHNDIFKFIDKYNNIEKEPLFISLYHNLKNICKNDNNRDLLENCKKLLYEVHKLWYLLKIDVMDDIFKNNNKYLYQYRSADFLKTALDSKKFWLIPTDYQNDPNEGNILFHYIIEKQEQDQNEEQEQDKLVAFISCFSTLKDNLVMWNSSYADNGSGICIGINVENLSSIGANGGININNVGENLTQKGTGTKDELPISKLGLYEVLYIGLDNNGNIENSDEDKKKIECLKEIKSLYKKITEDEYYKSNNGKFNGWINDLFVLIRYLVKFDDYKHEKEYRLLYIGKIKDNNYIKSTSANAGVHIETEEFLFKSEIYKDCIWLGPKNKSDILLKKIKHYLINEKLSEKIMLEKSNIEFR